MKESLEQKRKFLIGSSDLGARKRISGLIESHVANSVVFSSDDGINVLQKMENDWPHVLLIDANLSKKSGLDVVENILKKDSEAPAIIILSEIPDTEHFVDEVALGRVQFLSKMEADTKIHAAIVRALNWIGKGDEVTFSLKFLAAGDVLLRKGDKADFVYILRRGNMEALIHDGALEVILGQIGPQEFIGEMAYITGETRSADVVARTDCELIEIPIGHLDRLLFQKPAWAKALMKTLTNRVKLSNRQRLDQDKA